MTLLATGQKLGYGYNTGQAQTGPDKEEREHSSKDLRDPDNVLQQELGERAWGRILRCLIKVWWDRVG